jgi:hypothetical protein
MKYQKSQFRERFCQKHLTFFTRTQRTRPPIPTLGPPDQTACRGERKNDSGFFSSSVLGALPGGSGLLRRSTYHPPTISCYLAGSGSNAAGSGIRPCASSAWPAPDRALARCRLRHVPPRASARDRDGSGYCHLAGGRDNPLRRRGLGLAVAADVRGGIADFAAPVTPVLNSSC